MRKVEDMVNVKRAWMNTQLHACEKTPKCATPAVKCSEIRAEISVREGKE